jgi:hypothetical protein
MNTFEHLAGLWVKVVGMDHLDKGVQVQGEAQIYLRVRKSLEKAI